MLIRYGAASRMELRQLRYFVMVADDLNFTRAAARLHVAQPALSRQIKQLEDELGATLFHRNKRTVKLTSSGEAFLREARALLDQAERAFAHVRGDSGRTLNVGYVWGLFHSTAPAALQRLRTASSGVTVNLFDMSASEQARGLIAGRLDFGFIGTAFEAETAGLEMKHIGRCEFNAVLPQNHKLARNRLIRLPSLSQELFMLISEDQFPGASRIMEHACEGAGFQPRVLQVADRGHTLLGMVAAGCGVALLPETLRALPHAGVVFRRA
jgi:DNA-binding transcriptional LysR family regulator